MWSTSLQFYNIHSACRTIRKGVTLIPLVGLRPYNKCINVCTFLQLSNSSCVIFLLNWMYFVDQDLSHKEQSYAIFQQVLKTPNNAWKTYCSNWKYPSKQNHASKFGLLSQTSSQNSNKAIKMHDFHRL